jgi:hypothetical protein
MFPHAMITSSECGMTFALLQRYKLHLKASFETRITHFRFKGSSQAPSSYG